MQDKFAGTQAQPEVPTRQESGGKKSSAGRVVLFLFIAAICAGGFYYWRNAQQATTSAAQTTSGGGRRGGRGGGGGAIPVLAAMAQKQDLPVYLDGIGSVAAFYTVTAKSRVDGQLMQVNFTEGQDVKKGDLLAVIDPRPYQVALSQAQGALARDQAQLTDVKLNADRYSKLAQEGVIPQQQSDTQKALQGQLEGAIATDQANIDSAKLNITYSNITSPIDGRVGLRLVDPGNIVHASDPNGLLVITQVQPIAVIFTLPEDSLPTVIGRMHSGGALQVKALSRDGSSELAKGTLLTIDNQIDQTTGTYRLKAVFSNQDRSLWPNQFVNARLIVNVQKDAIIVPTAAVQHGSQGTFVYRVKANKKVEVEPVVVGITQGNITSVQKGLSAGDAVVTDGQDRLQAGTAVDARINAPGQAAGATDAAASDPQSTGKSSQTTNGNQGGRRGNRSGGSNAQPEGSQ